MKANELRIGNYYLHKNDLLQIDDAYSIYEKSKIIKEIKPIPLTEEWLLKFGFEENTSSWTNWEKPNYSKEVRLRKAFDYLTFNSKRIDYVHQLQNLYFALTGEELQYETR